VSARRGPKRSRADDLSVVQARNQEWWEDSPMTYDWADASLRPGTLGWFDDQDTRHNVAHRHFATDVTPFDRLIPYPSLAGKQVLEIGTGSGLHSELLARAGAIVTGIDLTATAVDRTTARFRLKGLTGNFQQWDAEQDRPDFAGRFDFVWSWGVIHHSSQTARIVRNVARWLTGGGTFAGMVYHRDSTTQAVALVRQWILKRKLFTYSIDEALWRNTDGFSARFYPADQWRDLLLGFFSRAEIGITGIDTDLPVPRQLRRLVLTRLPEARQQAYLARFGSFITFNADTPLGLTPPTVP
jgi:2-polyprenyl-3-methyl-5-hydroxy-6-metoxy-1,4-benzoquinol methylase